VLEIESRIGETILEIVEGPCRAHDGTPLVTPGTVAIGFVTYTIRRREPAAPLARARIDTRIYGYLAASLVVQLAVWLAAVRCAPFEKLVRHMRPMRLAHIQPQPEPPPPKPKPEPTKPEPTKPAAEVHASSAPAAAHRKPPVDEVDKLYGNEAAQIAHLAKVMNDIDVAGKLAHTDGPLYLPENDDSGFGGGGGHMQYDDKTYKVERWALPTFTRTHKGELAPVPAIEWCDEDSCSTRGPLELRAVLAQLLAHEAEIARCYREHTGDLVGNVRVRFPIGADGKVTGKLGTEDGPVGYGTGTVGRCVAKIAQGIRWPRANDETYVFVGLAFKPAAG